ncbi:lysocardiolipin acyltransferase 1-like [Anthonomus grandis grandis]|uniref:lysocardiolipin acyltransferase 1-like n=1 Tax=Anthonomus grandis grandis TaxID=2921223 RepID=UPI002165B6F8|nr:lysocardiolipin acyltransferase 1-like [Anthonomus grandis grandis]XP_050316029.1 lysocardiolipin acyltransferase 1-like [Anthonomus grandis grandis]
MSLGKHIDGLVYYWSWNSSIFGGYLMFVPLVFLQILTPKFHRKAVDLVVNYWQYYVTTLLFRKKCAIRVTGDPIDSNEISLVISNHRTRVDWNFLWPVMYHAVTGENRWWCSTKFVLKNSIRNIPGAGWVMQMAMYIFINRNWDHDKAKLDDYIEYVKDNYYKHILILFPEGTDYCPQTKASSDKFANANGLPKYEHVLHPRSTGFVYLVDQMRENQCLDAVYDITLIYPDECPQNEEELFLQGKFPKEVLAHIVKYPIKTLPVSKDDLKTFLEKRWKEKESTIANFKKTGHFLQGKLLKHDEYLTLPWAYFTHLFWILVTGSLLTLIYLSNVYCYLVIGHIVSLYLMPMITGLNMYKFRKKIFGLLPRVKEGNKCNRD